MRLLRGLLLLGPIGALVLASPALGQSLNTTLACQVDQYAVYSNLWGYTTQSGHELAILGTQNGTSIIDVTNPALPLEVAFIAGPASAWREMKTHAGYGYIVTEGSGGGMLIVDLEANPPDSVTTYKVNFDTAHTIAITDGVAYIMGARNMGTQVGTRIVSLANPTSPVELGSIPAPYIHDAVVRNDTMWASAINNDYQAVINVTNKAAPVVVTTWTWPGCNAHSCDLTTDGRYILTTDEVTGGDLHIFDITDLGDIRQVATYTANPAAIIHNVHIRGDLAFISYYTEGLRILDITNPEAPVEVGYYDTFPGASGGFNGAWGAFPYTPSERIYISDIQSGLFVVNFALPSGAVQGTVRESVGGPLIPDASVEILGGPSTTSSTYGIYKLFDDPGSVSVVASAFGFVADTVQVALTAGNATIHDFELDRLPNTPMNGNVTDAQTLAPLAGASLAIAATPLVEATDGGGDYAFAHVPYGVYMLSASRFGYATQHRSISVTASPPQTGLVHDFALEPAQLVEDFEAGSGGWVGPLGTDTATGGLWIWADPIGSAGGTVQPEDDHSDPGALCWVTANAASASQAVGTADVDGGFTTLLTPLFDVSGLTDPIVSYWRWYSNDAGTPAPPDTFRVDISNNAGGTWVPVERVVASSAWTEVTVRVSDYVTPSAIMRVRFIAEDIGAGSIVEAAIDDFMAYEGDGVTDVVPARGVTRLLANVPNPFNPATRLRFELAASGRAELRIFDVRGRLVRTLEDRRLDAGPHVRRWDGLDNHGRPVASGVYMARLVAPAYSGTQRLVLVR
jgi:choice-of-anchor B domain-containing protein